MGGFKGICKTLYLNRKKNCICAFFSEEDL